MRSVILSLFLLSGLCFAQGPNNRQIIVPSVQQQAKVHTISLTSDQETLLWNYMVNGPKTTVTNADGTITLKPTVGSTDEVLNTILVNYLTQIGKKFPVPGAATAATEATRAERIAEFKAKHAAGDKTAVDPTAVPAPIPPAK